MKMESSAPRSGGAPQRPRKKKSFGQKIADIFIPKKGDTGRQLASKILADAAVVLVVAALVVIGAVIVKYATGRNNQERWNEMYNPSSQASSSAPVSSSVSSNDVEEEPDNVWHFEAPELDPETGISVDFLEYYKTNPDILGHLSIPGTKLSLPVVKGSDNEYYLNHTLEKEYNPFGVPFADYRLSFTPTALGSELQMPGDYYSMPYQDHNVTLYGHAAADGTFFAPVKQYAGSGQDGIDFYKEHPLVNFDTIYGKGVYKVYAVALVNTDINNSEELFNYHDYNNMSEELFTNFLNEIDRRAFYKTDVDVVYGDRILTLSTCETTTTTTNRYALFCRKIRDGESLDVDVDKAEPNKEMIMPAEWVKKNGKANPWA